MKYLMPAEWEPHYATWLSWPKNKITWPGKLIKETESIYLQMILALLPQEKVHLLVDNAKTKAAVAKRLVSRKAKTQNLIFHQVKTVDTWIRDYGPIFVKPVSSRATLSERSESKGSRGILGQDSSARRLRRLGQNDSDVAFTKWIFNAWGGKYSDLATDTQVVDRLSYLKNFKRINAGIVLEGGSIDGNGRGTCLTTEQCLLNKNRNPHLSKKQIENYLKKYLGFKKIIWLKEGIEGDDTDGHVDDSTRFVGPRTIVTAVENNRSDKNHYFLDQNLNILKSEKDQEGKKFKIIELPMPGYVSGNESCLLRHVENAKRHGKPSLFNTRAFSPSEDFPRRGKSSVGAKGSSHFQDRLPASYANFYIANGVVLLPIYSHANDKKAAQILKKVFPARRIVPIECTALVYGLGSIHCVTQQQPL